MYKVFRSSDKWVVQVRTTHYHQSTHIITYQNSEHESDNIRMCPLERFTHYKKQFRLVLCYKKDYATLLRHVTIITC